MSATGGPRTPMDVRFWKHVRIGTPSECWEWTGNRMQNGYGTLRCPGREGGIVTAHRYSAMLNFGMFDRRLQVNHQCDNRSCVNPAHLYLGTHEDNMRDLRTRRRHLAHSQTHCKRGHEFTPENTRLYHGRRHCRTCQREVYDAARRARRAGADHTPEQVTA